MPQGRKKRQMIDHKRIKRRIREILSKSKVDRTADEQELIRSTSSMPNVSGTGVGK